jgi:hypothetical protein
MFKYIILSLTCFALLACGDAFASEDQKNSLHIYCYYYPNGKPKEVKNLTYLFLKQQDGNEYVIEDAIFDSEVKKYRVKATDLRKIEIDCRQAVKSLDHSFHTAKGATKGGWSYGFKDYNLLPYKDIESIIKRLNEIFENGQSALQMKEDVAVSKELINFKRTLVSVEEISPIDPFLEKIFFKDFNRSLWSVVIDSERIYLHDMLNVPKTNDDKREKILQILQIFEAIEHAVQGKLASLHQESIDALSLRQNIASACAVLSQTFESMYILKLMEEGIQLGINVNPLKKGSVENFFILDTDTMKLTLDSRFNLDLQEMQDGSVLSALQTYRCTRSNTMNLLTGVMTEVEAEMRPIDLITKLPQLL